MKTHQVLEERSLAMARAIVEKIDRDPERVGLRQARERCERWFGASPAACNREWMEILRQPWETVRAILLDDSEEGRRLRQNDPFCGILTPQERWEIYKRFSETGRT